MTKYSIHPDKIEISGHSGYGHQGTDIVCAAVSTLKEVLTDGLVMSGTGTAICERPEEAYFCVTVTDVTDTGAFLLRLFEVEMDALREAFPDYITRTD